MPRKLRVQYAGAIYHVMNRGNRHETIFDDDGALRIGFGENAKRGQSQSHAGRRVAREHDDDQGMGAGQKSNQEMSFLINSVVLLAELCTRVYSSP